MSNRQTNMYGKLPRMNSTIYFGFVTNTTAYCSGRCSLHLLLLKSSMNNYIIKPLDRTAYERFAKLSSQSLSPTHLSSHSHDCVHDYIPIIRLWLYHCSSSFPLRIAFSIDQHNQTGRSVWSIL